MPETGAGDYYIKALNRDTLVEEVYSQMRNNILDGVWKPKDRLPSEHELSRLFKVSRNTVRSSIQKLKAIGIVETRQGQGTFVRSGVNSDAVDTLLPMIYLTSDEIIDILEFRKSIEAGSVALAAERRDDEDLKRIEKHLREMETGIENHGDFAMADYLFHLAISQACKNPIFYRALSRLEKVLFAHFAEMSRDLNYINKTSLRNHKKILQAIKNKDPDGARRTLELNIQLSIDKLKSSKNQNLLTKS